MCRGCVSLSPTVMSRRKASRLVMVVEWGLGRIPLSHFQLNALVLLIAIAAVLPVVASCSKPAEKTETAAPAATAPKAPGAAAQISSKGIEPVMPLQDLLRIQAANAAFVKASFQAPPQAQVTGPAPKAPASAAAC